jgi:hypothetical protein
MPSNSPLSDRQGAVCTHRHQQDALHRVIRRPILVSPHAGDDEAAALKISSIIGKALADPKCQPGSAGSASLVGRGAKQRRPDAAPAPVRRHGHPRQIKPIAFNGAEYPADDIAPHLCEERGFHAQSSGEVR